MAYNFLTLTNDALTEINEVHLTAANFSSATGVHLTAKNAVNSALKTINQEEFQWPFYHQTRQVTLAVNQTIVPYNSATETINYSTVRLAGDDTLGNESWLLRQVDYEEFLQKYPDAEFNPSKYAEIPRYVYRKPNLTFGIYPPPNNTYHIHYDSYDIPLDLVDHDDIPLIPEQFRFIIRDGALVYLYAFKGDPESAGVFDSKFKDGIKTMRGIYSNRFEYVRSTARGV